MLGTAIQFGKARMIAVPQNGRQSSEAPFGKIIIGFDLLKFVLIVTRMLMSDIMNDFVDMNGHDNSMHGSRDRIGVPFLHAGDDNVSNMKS
eukprot:3374818-Karenia_brevis.AAC.1